MPWSWNTSLHLSLVLVLPNIVLLKSQEAICKYSRHASKREALREENTKVTVVCFSFDDTPPADGWGLWIMVSSQKIYERVGESQSTFDLFEGGGQWQQPVLRRGFRDSSCMHVSKSSVTILSDSAGAELKCVKGTVWSTWDPGKI